jgi:hypothetical protein
VWMLVCEPISINQKNVAVELHSFQNTPLLSPFPEGGGSRCVALS